MQQMVDYFKSGRSRTWPDLGTEIRLEPDLGTTRLYSVSQKTGPLGYSQIFPTNLDRY